ncbi:MAG: hypothetical protein ACXW2E_00760 [Nitrososphaeraceae archaeon]
MSFVSDVSDYSYRRTVVQCVERLTSSQIIDYLNTLTEEQVDKFEDHSNFLIIEVFNLTKPELNVYLCEIIFGWGWEGCDLFIKKIFHSLRTK